MNGWVDEWIGGWMVGWMDGGRESWMGRCVDGWDSVSNPERILEW